MSTTSLSPEMRMQLDQLNFEWDLDESKLLEESASQKITPFGFCFAFLLQVMSLPHDFDSS